MYIAMAVLCVAGYLLGSLPFGKWIAAAHGVDILSSGSKNIGATNVWRQLGWKAGLLVFLLDAAKGYAPGLAGGNLTRVFFDGDGFEPKKALLAGMFAVIGHSASFLLSFRGGKSVATALGVVLATSPDAAGCAFGVFLLVFAMFRIVSVGSICGVASAPVFAYAFGYDYIVVTAYALMALVIIYRHRGNIDRLIRGEEYRFRGK
jgi:glycerol-3-phosphate acyltransferase PlsY